MSEETWVERAYRVAISKSEAAMDLLEEACRDLACTSETRGIRRSMRGINAEVRKVVGKIKGKIK